MPRKVQTRRQRKAAALKNAAKEKQTTSQQPGNPECRNLIDEKEKVTITSSEELAKKKAAHQRGEAPKGNRKAWELGKAFDKDDSVLEGPFDEDEVLDQIWEDLQAIFSSSDEEVEKGGLSSKADLEKQSVNLRNRAIKHIMRPPLASNSSAEKGNKSNKTNKKLAKKKAACGKGKGLDKDNEQFNTDSLTNVQQAGLNKVLMDLEEIEKKIAHHLGGITGNGVPWELESYFDKKGQQSTGLDSISIIDEAIEEQVTKDPKEILPPSNEAEEDLIMKEPKEIIPPSNEAEEDLIMKEPSNEAEDEPIMKDPEEIFPPIDEAEVDLIIKELEEFFFPNGETEMDPDELLPPTNEAEENVDCSTSGGLLGDAEPMPPPKFFGNSGYFMLTGTNSQLAQQLKDLPARNITVESFVEVLPAAMADIVEQQLADLIQNRDQILGKMRNKHNLLESQRVPRQKKQRKYPKKTEN